MENIENLGELKAFHIAEMLEDGTEKLLIDGDLINHLRESHFDMKLIMIEDENGYHLVGTKSRKGSSYHCIIALTYMLEFEKRTISILGGGRIRLDVDEFVIYDKSGSYDAMDEEKTESIMKSLNVNFKMPHPSLYTWKKAAEYSYESVIKEIHSILSN